MFYEDAFDDRCATEAEADVEYALNVGAMRSDQAWILSDRDVWYANPYYQGPAVRHPEDDWEDEDRDIEASEFQQLAAASSPAYPFMGWDIVPLPADADDEMPF